MIGMFAIWEFCNTFELKVSEAPVQSDESVRDTQVNTDDTPKIITLLETQVQDLKAQLDTATEEKAELLKLLPAEKAEMRALMPPPEERAQKTEHTQIKPAAGFKD